MSDPDRDNRGEVGQRLREFREEMDLSQQDAAHELGVTSTTVSRWERGKNQPTVACWRRIIDLYKQDPRVEPSERPRGEDRELLEMLSRVDEKLSRLLVVIDRIREA